MIPEFFPGPLKALTETKEHLEDALDMNWAEFMRTIFKQKVLMDARNSMETKLREMKSARKGQAAAEAPHVVIDSSAGGKQMAKKESKSKMSEKKEDLKEKVKAKLKKKAGKKK